MQTIEPIISEHPFLKGLKTEHLAILSECAMQTQFDKDQMIFREGEVANRFYLILEGQVALESSTRDRGVVCIDTIGASDVLGWSWLFPPYYWYFDARALEATKAIFFYGTRLRERCEEDPELGYQLIKRTSQVLMHRLQATRRQLLERI